MVQGMGQDLHVLDYPRLHYHWFRGALLKLLIVPALLLAMLGLLACSSEDRPAYEADENIAVVSPVSEVAEPNTSSTAQGQPIPVEKVVTEKEPTPQPSEAESEPHPTETPTAPPPSTPPLGSIGSFLIGRGAL